MNSGYVRLIDLTGHTQIESRKLVQDRKIQFLMLKCTCQKLFLNFYKSSKLRLKDENN